MKYAMAVAMALAASAIAEPASAGTTIFSEDFNGATPQTYYAGGKVGQFTIDSGDLDVIGDLNGSFFGCPDGPGNNCVDTNGNHPSSISTVLDLVAGNTYRVSFDLAGNGPRDSGIYTLGSSLGTSGLQTFSIAPGAPYAAQFFDYVATTTGATTLTFASQTNDSPGYWGPIIDNVRVEDMTVPAAVPEPATWAMMLVGFGAVGSSLRRRRPIERSVSLV
jgi:hypothetical protein